MTFLIHHLDDARREAIARDLASKAARFMESRQYGKARKCRRTMFRVLELKTKTGKA